MKSEMVTAFNAQINAELYSEYLYLSMKAYFASKNLQGFVNWMNVQVQEEHAHAMGMFDYVIERNGIVKLYQIDEPKYEWNSPLEVFEHILEHEKLVTSKINALMDTAEQLKDRAALSFLDWYLKEQVEEESTVSGVLETLKMIGDNTNSLLALDDKLSTRTFVAPVIK